MASSIGNLEILPLAVRSHHPRTSQFQSPPSPEMEPPFKATPANTQEETQIQNFQFHSCNTRTGAPNQGPHLPTPNRKHKSKTSNPTAATQPHKHQKWSLHSGPHLPTTTGNTNPTLPIPQLQPNPTNTRNGAETWQSLRQGVELSCSEPSQPGNAFEKLWFSKVFKTSFTQQSKQAVSASAAVRFWHTLPGLTGTLVPDNLKVERVLLPTWHIGANPAQRSHIANSIQLKSSMEKTFSK